MSKPGPDQSSPFTLLALRLAPLYVWTAVLTAQAHKEERFMFPAYPLICFNAAVALYLIRGWMEVAYISATKSSYRVIYAYCLHMHLLTFALPYCHDRLQDPSYLVQ